MTQKNTKIVPPTVPETFKSVLAFLKEAENELAEARTALDAATANEAAARAVGPGRDEREALAKAREAHEDAAHLANLRRESVRVARAEVLQGLSRDYSKWVISQTAVVTEAIREALPAIVAALDKVIVMNAAHNATLAATRESLCADLGILPSSVEAQALRSTDNHVGAPISQSRDNLQGWLAVLAPQAPTPTATEHWVATADANGTIHRVKGETTYTE